MGLRIGVDTVMRRRNPSPSQESKTGRPACSLVTIMTRRKT